MPLNLRAAFLYGTHDPFVAKEVQEVLHYSRKSKPEEDEDAVYLMFVARTCLAAHVARNRRTLTLRLLSGTGILSRVLPGLVAS